MTKPSASAASASATVSPAHRHNNDDDDVNMAAVRNQNSAVALRATEPISGDNSDSSPWHVQLQKFLSVMVQNKKAATSDEVRAYYKRQKKLVENMIKSSKNQDKFLYHAPGVKDTTSLMSSHDERKDGAVAEAAHGPEPASPASTASADEEEDDVSLPSGASLVLNVLLLGAKTFAAVQSGSLTVVASVLDSAMDLVSGVVLVVVACLISRAKENTDAYPLGPGVFENLGILVFAVLLCVASSKLLEVSVTALADVPSPQIDAVTLAVMGSVVISKGIAYCLCRSSTSAMVQALASDHLNDTISNSVGLVALALSAHVNKIFDPLFALACTLFIMGVWSKTAYEQLRLLSGVSAEVDVLNELTALALRTDERIVGVDTVRAVHSGHGLTVEIDLVLPPDMPLSTSHDIGEKLQLFLETPGSLESGLTVTRAYVHLDYETSHNPREHR